MKTSEVHFAKLLLLILAATFLLSCPLPAEGSTNKLIKVSQPDTLTYLSYKGVVCDRDTRNPLPFASLSVEGTNLATISNSEGEFLLKIPKGIQAARITISFIGYKNKQLEIGALKADRNRIEMEPLVVALNEIKIFPRDPEKLVRAMMNKRGENYFLDPTTMTAFYRETIKKRRTYVSLTEAVVELYKQPYTSPRVDVATLFKARKSADYTKLDTIAFKLQGGPYTTLSMDIMKNPEMIFTEDMFGKYGFKIENISRINDRMMYVISFNQLPFVSDPLYAGKLFIDTESLALISATFSLNITNKELAAEMFIRKKPTGAKVYPTSANYHVDYREKGGRWYYSYSRGEIHFTIEWEKRFFNTYYETTIEMAVTDWSRATEKPPRYSERIRENEVFADEIPGFADKSFWGEYNVIEPEKPIESAIRKIQRKLERSK